MPLPRGIFINDYFLELHILLCTEHDWHSDALNNWKVLLLQIIQYNTVLSLSSNMLEVFYF